MRFIIPTLSIAAVATALPSQQPRTTTPSQSKGFYLAAKLADGASDIDPPVNGLFLGTAHTGAGLNAAVFYTAGRLFYQNGTAGDSTIVTDGGTPPFPSSLTVNGPTEPRRILDINVGEGTANAIVETNGQPQLVNGLGEGGYLACIAEVPYYRQDFTTLQFDYSDGQAAVPEGCVRVTLVPQCAELNELPDGSYSSHEFAMDVACSA
ncbi:hypothetical protein C8A00DRAFT_16751 [Chaetomidium leptoderma]|uniref:DUF7907 domain-containing protein n=1 Tax=Chaetomidium leptoderma TaxID=669021 RepID=A0AAN6ZUY6_9PEZI|nr:hypothetical protein C8A00DRAFT_16751 [Chaetomidium leptoderma]